MPQGNSQSPVSKPSPAQERKKERLRRRNELVAAALAFIAVVILTSIQIGQLRAGDALFMAVFNFNFVLLLGILFVVIRNAAKILLERRRNILGSRLSTRLAVAFVTIALIPCLLMLFVTTKYVQLSMDFWFKDQIETSMESALDVARTIYDRSGVRLIKQGKLAEEEIKERQYAWTGKGMDSLLIQKQKEYNLALFGLFTTTHIEQNWHGAPGALAAWNNGKKSIQWDQLGKKGEYFFLQEYNGIDYLFAVIAIDKGTSGYLILGESMGAGFQARLDRISKGAGEYKNLRKIKQPLKLMLYSSLAVLTLLIVMGAIWFGLRIAREIAAPLMMLSNATASIASGDLSIRLQAVSNDEMSMLIRAFNKMAEDLEQSQRKLIDANAMLEEQNARIAQHSNYIETILNNIAAGVISFMPDGTILTANQAACSILESNRENLLNQPVRDFFPEPFGSVIQGNSEQVSYGKRNRQSIILPINNGERRLLVNVVRFASNGFYQGAIAVFEDISELERMQRMAAWREVAKRIAHEIKNPLTPIKLSAQRLEKKFHSQITDPAFCQSTQLIVRQVEHLQEMVQEFSAFAKLPEVVLTLGSIQPILEQTVQLFSTSHPHIQWKLAFPPQLPNIPMDKKALQRVFMNLFSNAAEALELTCQSQPFVDITITINNSSHHMRIDIADNGPGLTEEERTRLFEPYFSRKKGGTGLGLTIVRSIITDHNGYIRVNRRQGGGATISIELPLA